MINLRAALCPRCRTHIEFVSARNLVRVAQGQKPWPINWGHALVCANDHRWRSSTVFGSEWVTAGCPVDPSMV
jgi:hypothetical protein